MKPLYDIEEAMLKNEDKFKDPFFRRFKLRNASEPLQLNEQVSKNYLFPTFYGDVTCAMAIFLCDYRKAKAIMPHPKVKPVKMPLDRAIVAFACYEYKNVMNVVSYNEIAMTIPVMVNPAVNVPVLPMVTKIFKEFGYYVFSMPVTSLENRIRGRKIWGLPKDVFEIDIYESGDECVSVCKDEAGKLAIELRVPMKGKPTKFDETSNLYSRLGDKFLQSETNFKATFEVNSNFDVLFNKNARSDRVCLITGDSPAAKVLKELDIEEKPFQFRFAKHVNSCFDLPNMDYKSPVKF
jgi:hypothetical protein